MRNSLPWSLWAWLDKTYRNQLSELESKNFVCWFLGVSVLLPLWDAFLWHCCLELSSLVVVLQVLHFWVSILHLTWASASCFYICIHSSVFLLCLLPQCSHSNQHWFSLDFHHQIFNVYPLFQTCHPRRPLFCEKWTLQVVLLYFLFFLLPLFHHQAVFSPNQYHRPVCILLSSKSLFCHNPTTQRLLLPIIGGSISTFGGFHFTFINIRLEQSPTQRCTSNITALWPVKHGLLWLLCMYDQDLEL